MKITLDTWAARHFDPPPTLPTLRAWARSGHIQHAAAADREPAVGDIQGGCMRINMPGEARPKWSEAE